MGQSRTKIQRGIDAKGAGGDNGGPCKWWWHAWKKSWVESAVGVVKKGEWKISSGIIREWWQLECYRPCSGTTTWAIQSQSSQSGITAPTGGSVWSENSIQAPAKLAYYCTSIMRHGHDPQATNHTRTIASCLSRKCPRSIA